MSELEENKPGIPQSRLVQTEGFYLKELAFMLGYKDTRKAKLTQIGEWLAAYSIDIKNKAKENDLSGAIYAENNIRDILNCILGYHLVNANHETHNIAGIDLVDKEKKICIQITTTKTPDKIKASLQKTHLILRDTSEWKFQIFLLSVEDADVKKLKSNKKLADESLGFSPTEDILDFSYLLRLANDLEMTKLNRLYRLCRKMFASGLNLRMLYLSVVVVAAFSFGVIKYKNRVDFNAETLIECCKFETFSEQEAYKLIENDNYNTRSIDKEEISPYVSNLNEAYKLFMSATNSNWRSGSSAYKAVVFNTYIHNNNIQYGNISLYDSSLWLDSYERNDEAVLLFAGNRSNDLFELYLLNNGWGDAENLTFSQISVAPSFDFENDDLVDTDSFITDFQALNITKLHSGEVVKVCEFRINDELVQSNIQNVQFDISAFEKEEEKSHAIFYYTPPTDSFSKVSTFPYKNYQQVPSSGGYYVIPEFQDLGIIDVNNDFDITHVENNAVGISFEDEIKVVSVYAPTQSCHIKGSLEMNVSGKTKKITQFETDIVVPYYDMVTEEFIVDLANTVDHNEYMQMINQHRSNPLDILGTYTE